MSEPELSDPERVAAFCDQTLGDRQLWVGQVHYPNSLALCLIDSIWSLASHYDTHVVRVLDRYRHLRDDGGAEANSDGASDLVRFISDVGGSERLADLLNNRQRTSSRNGVLKAEAIRLAATMLSERAIESPQDLLRSATTGPSLLTAWRQIPGQKSSLTGWRYLLLLAGAQEVKPDRMILRFVADALGRDLPEDEAADVVRSAAELLSVQARELDYRVWQYQSGRIRTDEVV